MKYLYILLLPITLLYSQQVEISADSFEADENKMVSILKGNVLLQKGADIIHAEKLTITFDKQNKPINYLAQGGISFDINTENQNFDGHAHTLTYNPKTLIYDIKGDAYIHEKSQNSKLYGQHIMIDRISGKSTIKGSKQKPVKFIFEVKE